MSGSSGYIPDPTNSSQPTGSVDARTAAAEFRALKAYISTLDNVAPTWNPQDKSLVINLFSGNLLPLIGDPSVTYASGVRCTVGKTGFQEYYWENTIGVANGIIEIGLASLANSIYNGTTGAHLGLDTYSIGWRSNGEIWYGGVIISSGWNYGFGERVAIAFSARGDIRFIRNGFQLFSTTWSGAAAQTTKYPACFLDTAGDYVVTNFGASAFTEAIPSGVLPFYEANVQPTGPQNFLYNSDMWMDERHDRTLQAAIANGAYMSDRWAYFATQAGRFDAQNFLCSSADQFATQGSLAYQRLTVAIQTVPGAADSFFISQRVEGTVFARNLFGNSKARESTLLFYYRSNVTRIFSGTIQNATRTRSFPFTFSTTPPTLNTWIRAAISIPGCIDGTWEGDTDIGVEVMLNLGTGFNFKGFIDGSWKTTDIRSDGVAQDLVNQAPGSFLDITGVELKPGYYPLSAEREVVSPSQEAANCSRYYFKRRIINASYTNAAATISYPALFPVPMRVTPSGVITANANTNCANSTFTPVDIRSCAIASVGTALGAFIQDCVLAASAEF